MITATLTKVLHGYGDLRIQETMRFADHRSALSYSADVLGRRIKPYCGTAYTVVAVEF